LTPSGMLYVIAAFITRPLHELVHSSVTARLLANRRYLGLSFASWHLVHWPVITGFVLILGPEEFWANFGDFVIPAGTILLVITIMAATSNDRAQRFLGMRLWSAIHTLGLYAIWSWAFTIYLGRLPGEELHNYVYLWLLIGALAFRWIMTARRVLQRAP